jgi:hypothetical protein
VVTNNPATSTLLVEPNKTPEGFNIHTWPFAESEPLKLVGVPELILFKAIEEEFG